MVSKYTKMAHVPLELIGATGRRYHFKELLQHKPQVGSVWVATYGLLRLLDARADDA